MRRVLVIGIGAGDPEQVTMQAVRRMNEVDVFLLVDKGEEKDDLAEVRREIIRRYVDRPGYRIVTATEVDRDRAPADYLGTVRTWRQGRADLVERMLLGEVGADQCAGILVWGDPTLYDSTLAVLAEVLRRGNVPFTHEVIPGISSVSALAAAHRVSLTRVGAPMQITTGRRLSEGFPDGVDDVVVMLDSRNAFDRVDAGAGIDIHWGAYLGTPDEMLVRGPLPDAAEEIRSRRAEARARTGWIMDTYLLRRNPSSDSRLDG